MHRSLVAILVLPLMGICARADDLDKCALTSGDEQIAACTKVIKASGDDKDGIAIAYHYRGRAHYEAQRYDQAIADLSQAIALNPRITEAHYYRASALSMTGKDVQAIPDYDALLAADPKDPFKGDANTLCHRGVAYLKTGKDDARGFADIERAITLKPDDTYCILQKADVYAERGNVEQQIAALSQAISVMPRDPKSSEAYYHRGEAYLKRGDNDKALADYTSATDVDPTSTSALFARALLLEKLGRLDQAVADYDKLLRLKPGDQYYTDARAKLIKAKGSAPTK